MENRVYFEGVIYESSDKERRARVKLASVIGPFSEAVINNSTVGWEKVLHPFTGKIQALRVCGEGYANEKQDAIVAVKMTVLPMIGSP